MLSHAKEQEAIESVIRKSLGDLTHTNALRLKAGIRILMTTDEKTFETLCSATVQEKVQVLKNLLQHPEHLAPVTSETESGLKAVQEHIKSFTLNNLSLLDDRTSILPKTWMVAKSVQEGERLKSVVHTSAIRNVVISAEFVEALRKRLQKIQIEYTSLDVAIENAIAAMNRLHDAVIANDTEIVIRSLAVPGIDINYIYADGLTLIHLAAREGHVDILKILLKMPEMKVNLVSNNGWTALHMAARMGFERIVKILLQVPGINVNAVNSDGWTPLHWAAWHGHNVVVTELLEAPNIEVNKRDQSNTTALHWAARNGNGDVVMILSALSQIDINPIDVDKKTPLYFATQFDHLSSTSALASHPKIDPNIADIDGLTPLHWAARNGRADLVEILMAIPGIRTDLLDNNEMTAADWAVQNGYEALVPLMNPHYPKPSLWQRIKDKFIVFFRVFIFR